MKVMWVMGSGTGSDDVVSAYLSKSKKRGKGLLAFFNYAKVSQKNIQPIVCLGKRDCQLKDSLLPARNKRFS